MGSPSLVMAESGWTTMGGYTALFEKTTARGGGEVDSDGTMHATASTTKARLATIFPSPTQTAYGERRNSSRPLPPGEMRTHWAGAREKKGEKGKKGVNKEG
eukprot:Sspe_Gene.29635::Locus_14187_Transcript_2_2_Confidence_0.800_Length_2441::g.29635::m.29635